jgi:ATP-dependent helicase/nuclease subunit B
LTVVTLRQALSALEKGATLVSASQRLSRHLNAVFDRHQASDGRSVWPTADILPWQAWLVRCWSRASDRMAAEGEAPPVLLSPSQQIAVWERVIDSVHGGRDLVEPVATAPSAIRAWELLNAWLGPISEGEWQSAPDTRAFHDWQRAYRKMLAKNNWLDLTLLPDRLRAEDPSLWMDASRPLLLAGFEELSPQQCRLLDRLRAFGLEIMRLETEGQFGPLTETVMPCAEASAEIAAAAQWAAQLLLTSAPDTAIAVVIPSLGQCRAQVERVFTEILHPDAAGDPGAGRLFDISLGLPLSEYPIIFSALTALRCAGPSVRLVDIGHVLRSPFFAGAGLEGDGRALADAALRRIGAADLPLARIIDEAAKLAPILCGSLKKLRSTLQGTQSSGPPSHWARVFSVLLEALGWPGDRTRTSAEYQTLTRWKSLLSSFAALDSVAASMRLSDALPTLRRLARDDVYQPRAGASGVQILGLLETSGLSFDHLWVSGLHDEVWPVPAAPDAFLPAAAQQRSGAPHSTSERELSFARETTERLRRSARHLVWSYPLFEEDRALRPSALLPGCPVAEQGARAGNSWAETVQRAGVCLTEDPDQTPPLPAGPVRGGARILQDMAACAFKAYARHRLGADGFAGIHPGLDASGRGSLLHNALRYLWSELKTREGLQSPDLPASVRRAVATAVAETAGSSPACSGRFRELEQERLERLILEWLQFERQRGPFEVTVREEKRQVRIGPLEMSIRLDRVDRLPDGRQVMLDYKTNRKTPNAWEGERPEEPQIPLYASTHETPLAAVAFAQVVAGKTAFKGFASDPAVLPGVRAKEDWEATLDSWRRALEGLARRFAGGAAFPDPKHGRLTCRQCDLAALCRIEERIELAGEDS